MSVAYRVCTMRVFIVADNRGQFNDWCSMNRINPAGCEFVPVENFSGIDMHSDDMLIVASSQPRIGDARAVA